MLHFDSDYMEGAHPAVMRQLCETNLEQTVGYGSDEYTKRAKQKVKEAIGMPEAEVHFLVGGTQTNATPSTVLYSVTLATTPARLPS